MLLATRKIGGCRARDGFLPGLRLGDGIFGTTVVAVIRLPSTARQILALDTLTLILVVLTVLYGDAQRTPYYLNAGLILTLLALVATLAAARYYGE